MTSRGKAKPRVYGTVTAAAAKAAFGKHINTIQNWFAKGCPRDSIEAIYDWVEANVTSRTVRDGSTRSREEVVARFHGLPFDPPAASQSATTATATAATPPPQLPSTPPALRQKPSAPPAGRSSSFDLKQDKAAADASKSYEQARRLKMQNDVYEGNLVDMVEVERFLAGLAIEVRTHFEQLPELMRMSFPAEHRTKLVAEAKEYVRDILKRLKGWTLKFDEMMKNAPREDDPANPEE